MKTHFGFYEDCGDYEHPCGGYESTICGVYSEKVTEEWTTSDWDLVSCKRCLKFKDKVIKAEEEDEKFIVEQMGDMAEFFSKQQELKIKKCESCHFFEIKPTDEPCANCRYLHIEE